MTAPSELSEFVRTLQRSADLVQRWADAPVPGRPTLRELMQFRGLPGWEMLAADLALYRVPPALRGSRDGALARRVRRRLRALRHSLRRAPSRDATDCARWPSRPVALFLGFTPYMTRDILLPVVAAMEARSGLAPVVLSAQLDSPENDSEVTHSLSRHWTGDVEMDGKQIAGAIHAGPSRMIVGVDLSCTHHRAVRSGTVTGIATALHEGGTVATYAIRISDEDDRLVCTARLTCLVRALPAKKTGQ